jgi:hypothetical protein
MFSLRTSLDREVNIVGVILISLGGIAIIATGAWLMLRVNRADQRKIERIREEWEASGREKPWSWGISWGDGSGGGG